MDLRDKARKLLEDARAIVNAADKETRGMSADELEKYERIMSEFDALQATIRATDRLAEFESRGAGAGTAARTDRAESAAAVQAEADLRDELVTPERRAFDKAIGSHEYRSAFFNGYVRRFEVRADLKVGTDSAGGYLVPKQYERTLVQKLNDENVMRTLATVFRTTGGGQLTMPSVSSHGSATYGPEESVYTTSDETFGHVTFNAYKGKTLIKVSEELLEDAAFDVEAYLANEFGRRFGALEETKFFVGAGSGSSEPTGVIGAGTVGVTTVSPTAVTADEIVDLYHALRRPYRRRAVWTMNDATIKAVRKLKTGVSGDNTYLWSAGLGANEPDTLLGRPVVPVSSMATIAATAKVIAFGDFSYYWIRDVSGISFQRLVELYSGNGQVGFRGRMRNDGNLTLAEAVQVLQMHA